jgi:hypothetical protein
MKKITIIATSIMLFVFANVTAAEKRVGISAAYTMLSSDGTETMKSSGTKTSKSHDEDVVVPSIFFEVEKDNGLVIGLDFMPVAAELGSGTNARTDVDTNDNADTAGTNKISAELTSHTTLYLSKSLGDSGAYLKGGLALATIDTTETLATGSSYDDKKVHGLLIGLGVNRDIANGTFFRTELTYTDYNDVTIDGSLDSDGVKNKIDADIDAVALRISIGKAF